VILFLSLSLSLSLSMREYRRREVKQRLARGGQITDSNGRALSLGVYFFVFARARIVSGRARERGTAGAGHFGLCGSPGGFVACLTCMRLVVQRARDFLPRPLTRSALSLSLSLSLSLFAEEPCAPRTAGSCGPREIDLSSAANRLLRSSLAGVAVQLASR